MIWLLILKKKKNQIDCFYTLHRFIKAFKHSFRAQCSSCPHCLPLLILLPLVLCLLPSNLVNLCLGSATPPPWIHHLLTASACENVSICIFILVSCVSNLLLRALPFSHVSACVPHSSSHRTGSIDIVYWIIYWPLSKLKWTILHGCTHVLDIMIREQYFEWQTGHFLNEGHQIKACSLLPRWSFGSLYILRK